MALETVRDKYVKFGSLTWWASAVPLVFGIALALGEAFSFAPLTTFVAALFPGQSPAGLINLGLIGIGLRGAHK